MQGKVMKLGKAIYTKTTPIIQNGHWSTCKEEFEVRVMAIVERYAMVRRWGAMPFVVMMKDLSEKVR